MEKLEVSGLLCWSHWNGNSVKWKEIGPKQRNFQNEKVYKLQNLKTMFWCGTQFPLKLRLRVAHLSDHALTAFYDHLRPPNRILWSMVSALKCIEWFESMIAISSGESIFSTGDLNKFLKIPDTVSTLKGVQLMREQTPIPKTAGNIGFDGF